jgi:hypothetical protein
MSARLRHNGCDTLMLGFDHDLRRLGFAGNSCQIILDLSAAIDSTILERRVAELVRQNPVLTSRPARGWTPQWKPTRTPPRVRVHAETASASLGSEFRVHAAPEPPKGGTPNFSMFNQFTSRYQLSR